MYKLVNRNKAHLKMIFIFKKVFVIAKKYCRDWLSAKLSLYLLKVIYLVMFTSFLKNIYLNNLSVSDNKVCSGCGCTCPCECKDCEECSTCGGD